MKKIAASLLLSASVLALLIFGDPQWNRLIYIFQAYVFPGGIRSIVYPDMRFVLPPSDFTGQWRQWHMNGRQLSEIAIRNGKASGPGVFWRSNGAIAERGQFVNDLPEGVWEYFDTSGRRTQMTWRNGDMIDGEAHGFIISSGRLVRRRQRR